MFTLRRARVYCLTPELRAGAGHGVAEGTGTLDEFVRVGGRVVTQSADDARVVRQTVVSNI